MMKIPVKMPRDGGFTFATVDDDKFDLVNQYRWFVGTHGYAMANTPQVKRKKSSISMHRLIMQASRGDGQWYDHRDLNKLNNTSENLRKCTPTQNNANRRRVTPGLKGVSFISSCPNRPWRAAIGSTGPKGLVPRRIIGYFATQ